MEMWFLIWLAIGFVSVAVALLFIARDTWLSLKEAAMLIVFSAFLSILGPVATTLIIYWFWRGWSYKFSVDENDRILYPWRKE